MSLHQLNLFGRLRVSQADLIVRLDKTLEYTLYLCVFTIFRWTTLRTVVFSVMLAALLLRLVLSRGDSLRPLRHPLSLIAGAFLVLMAASTFYSGDVARSLSEYVSNFGPVALLAMAMPLVLRDEKTLRRFLYATAIAGLYLNFIQIKGIVIEYRETGLFLHDVELHRPHSFSLIFYLPFVVALASLLRGWRSAFWWAAVVFQMTLLLAASGRAAWLSAAVGMVIWLAVSRDKRLISVGVLGALLAVSFLAVLPRESVVVGSFARGFEIWDRKEFAWEPATEMIMQRPFTGYGHGSFVYAREYDEQGMVNHRDTDPEWVGQLGPHHHFLDIWFSAGVLALVAFVLLCARYFARVLAFTMVATSPVTKFAALAALSAFTAVVLVHSQFGPLGTNGWRAFGVVLGLGIALLLTDNRRQVLTDVQPSRSD
jgi:O-antigen ligase